MKTKSLIVIICLFIFIPLVSFANSNLAEKLSGRILLQVEEKGEAYYVNPANKNRYFLGRPDDAFSVMRELGLGISEKDFNSFNNKAPQRLSGRILLRVEANGEAYYVSPVDLKMHFLDRPADAFSVMRNLGLGISNKDLNKIDENLKFKNTKNNSQPEAWSEPVIPTCNSWRFSDWTECSLEGRQSRDILDSLPYGCVGGSPEVERFCEIVRSPNQDWLDEINELEKYYPVIISMFDNKGNINTASTFNITRVQGDYQNKNTLTRLEVGDIITFTINARDPIDRPLLYAWSSNIYCSGKTSSLSYGLQDSNYSNNDSISCVIIEDDLNNPHSLGIIRVEGYIKSEKEGFRNPSGFDDSISMSYNDIPYQPFLP